MNRKQFGILLGLVVVLGGAGLMLYKKSSASWIGGGAATGQKLLGEFQVNDIAQVVIQHAGNQVTLARKDDLWRVRERGDYPANFSQLSGLLLKLRDLKVVQVEQVGASQLPRLELGAPGPGTNTATLLELRDSSGKVLKSLLLGKKHMQKSKRPSQFGDMEGGWPDGRYVMTDPQSGTVSLISDALADVEPKPQDWISKDFLKVEKAKSLSVTFPEATNSWQLTRETEAGEWKLAGAAADEKLDSTKTSSLNSPLSSTTVQDVAIGLTPEQTGLDKPTDIKITTFDGFEYAVKVGLKTNEDVFMTVAVNGQFAKERTPGKDEKPEDKEKLDKDHAEQIKKLNEKLAEESLYAKWTYLLSSWPVDSLLKKRSELIEAKKQETPSTTTSAPPESTAPAVDPLAADPLKPSDSP